MREGEGRVGRKGVERKEGREGGREGGRGRRGKEDGRGILKDEWEARKLFPVFLMMCSLNYAVYTVH